MVRGADEPLPGAIIYYMIAVLSGTRNVRAMCVCEDVSCCVIACVCGVSAAEFALMLLLFPGSASTRRFLLLMMPKRRDCAKSVRKYSDELNRM